MNIFEKVLLLVILGLTVSSCGPRDRKIIYYVATKGDDSFSGSLPAPNNKKTDGPFASITKARDTIRQLPRSKEGPITVMVREGIYFLPETIVFTPEDSGTEKCPITYMVYPGEKVILSGGRIITGWTLYKGKIMVCSIPEAEEGKWKFRQLFFKGQRQIRARTPNYESDNPLYGGWSFVEVPAIPGSKTAFEYKPGIFKHWKDPTLGEVNIFPRYGWGNNVISIKEVNEKKHIITLAENATYEIRSGDRFYLGNLLEELDQPTEWCLDWKKGELYFWPSTGFLTKDEVIVPKLSRLITMQGEKSVPIKYINIIGFTFTETLSLGKRDQDAIAAIYLENTEYCSIKNNSFHKVGGDSVYLKGYNEENRIVGNEIAYAGWGGVILSGMKKGHPLNNIISYNHIHHCGIIHKSSGAISLFSSGNNLISHNLIHDLPRMGIMIGDFSSGGTDEDIANCGNNIVEYNELYHLSLETCDAGGIYMNYRGKRKVGNIIRYNIIRDVVGCHTTTEGNFLIPHRTWGIYLDDWSSNTEVYGNIVVGNVLGGVMVHGGKNNIIRNNIFVNSGKYQIFYSNIENYMSGNRFFKNIVYYTEPGAKLMEIRRWTDYAIAESDYNLFFHTKGEELIIEGIPGVNSFDQWQKLGFDKNSIIADPLFMDPANSKYSLKPNSPALKLGFKPISTSKIGLKKDN